MKISTTIVSACIGICCIWVVIPSTSVTEGCATAPPEHFDVRITDEAALIVWDSENQTEHFIRNAHFQTEAEDFGFLVPTPTVPSLHEVKRGLFSELARLTAARIEYQMEIVEKFRQFKPGTGFDLLFPRAGAPGASDTAAAGGVEVIAEIQVGGYDATVLKATDSAELLKWLEDHEYHARPELLSWLEIYTSQQWYITAFRVTQLPDGQQAVAGAVRITFQTDKPFYPYREPEDSRSDAAGSHNRLLRLFVLSDQKMEASVGDTQLMPARTVWAGKLEDHAVNFLNDSSGATDAAESKFVTLNTTYLTEFEDHSSPRPGTDELYLQPAADKSPVERPPIIRTNTKNQYSPNLHKWPFWLLGFISVGIFIMRRARKER